jgi:hypothetical protein
MEIKPIQIKSNPPPIIPTIEPPVTRRTEQTVIPQVDMPIINIPDTTVKYPVIDVPTQEEFDAAVRAEQKKQEEAQEEKTRGLPDTKPVLPQVQVPVQNTQENRNIFDQPPTNTQIGAPEIYVPILGNVPIPTNKEVALAGTTAVAATAAAIFGKSAVEFLLKFFKPIANQLFVRGKKLLNKDLTDYELQIFFAFEKDRQMKKVTKLLKKEQKKDKQRQYKEFHNK